MASNSQLDENRFPGGDVTSLKFAIAFSLWSVHSAIGVTGSSWYNHKGDNWGILVAPVLVMGATFLGTSFWKQIDSLQERLNTTFMFLVFFFLNICWTPFLENRDGWTWVCVATGLSQCVVPASTRLVRLCVVKVYAQAIHPPPPPPPPPPPSLANTTSQNGEQEETRPPQEQKQRVEEEAEEEEDSHSLATASAAHDEINDDDDIEFRVNPSSSIPVPVVMPHMPSVATFVGDSLLIAVFFRIITPSLEGEWSAKDVGIQMVCTAGFVIFLNHYRIRNSSLLQWLMSIGAGVVPCSRPTTPAANTSPMRLTHVFSTIHIRISTVFITGLIWGTSYGFLDRSLEESVADNVDVISRTLAIAFLFGFGLYARRDFLVTTGFPSTSAASISLISLMCLTTILLWIIPGITGSLLVIFSATAAAIICTAAVRIGSFVLSGALTAVYTTRRGAYGTVFLSLFLGFVVGLVVVQSGVLVVSFVDIGAIVLVEIVSLTVIYPELSD